MMSPDVIKNPAKNVLLNSLNVNDKNPELNMKLVIINRLPVYL